MAAFTTIAAAASLAITAGTTTSSFIQAGKQKKAQRRAEREASRKMKQAREKLEMNYMESLSIPLEAYEREMEAINVQTAQATQAAVEGSQRGVAATAGQVQQVASEAQANQRTAMAEDLFNLEAATAEEASRLRDIGVNLDLAEAEGAQQAAADASRARAQAIQQGIEGVGNTVQAGLNMVPLYKRASVGQRQAALSAGDYSADTLQKAGLTQADINAVGQMGKSDYRSFEKNLTPQQRGLLFNAGYYERLMPGGMDAFYNIGSGTAIGQ